MARTKCALCGRNLRDGEWKYMEVDDGTQKVCMNKYRCDQRRRIAKSKAEKAAGKDSVESAQTAVEVVKDRYVGNYKRQCLELIAAVLVLVAAIVLFAFVAGGSV